ncbi:MAG: hypothetical protein LBU58_02485, partial [Clostridiales bacterium]|nr:hypothetical protein [Clostridiales bacterium]
MSGAARKADEAAELRAARPGGAVDAAEAWGVYVHVPFCAARCAYCDFNTYSGMERYVGAYFRALRRELRAFWEERAYAADAASTPVAGAAGSDFAYADTVFFGGGTPSFVDPVYLCDLLDLIPRAGGDGFACGGAGFTGAGGGEEGAWE